jgi:hypothetical protein
MSKLIVRPIPRHKWENESHNKHMACDWTKDPVRLHHTAMVFKYKKRTRRGRIQEEIAHMRLLKDVALGRGYADISYNYVVFPSGRVYVGRGEQVIGAHTINHNTEPGICLAGNFEIQKVTVRMKRTVNGMAAHYLPRKFGTRRKLYPHCKTFATSCPGKNARKAFKLSC